MPAQTLINHNDNKIHCSRERDLIRIRSAMCKRVLEEPSELFYIWKVHNLQSYCKLIHLTLALRSI